MKLLKLDWASQQAITHITEILLNKSGVDTEIVEADSLGQWFFLNSGRANVQMEVWQGNGSSPYYHLVEKGKIINAGSHLVKGRKEWWYPEHVKELCPGLPDWRVLNDCMLLFAHEFSGDGEVSIEENAGTKGILYAGPSSGNLQGRIRALELNFDVKYVRHDDVLWQYLDSAVNIQKPIILLNWNPNWVESIYLVNTLSFLSIKVTAKLSRGGA
ncbi:glycine betaine ABC transporter substrate-binding protein [Veronia nyctiphanis]|uniref:glycine betaine ABC transporter substrate-binding protein n=1 Tax=Veronia nyctiphanis TaxID=1278244 RepID=UPI0013760551|nr:glycine betaine ABC transporter substrate-binding protein [Veronia nyctiphanis]